MLKAVLLIGTTWTTLSLLFCLAWARALMVLSDTRCTAAANFRGERPRVNGVLRISGAYPLAEDPCSALCRVPTKSRNGWAARRRRVARPENFGLGGRLSPGVTRYAGGGP